MVAIAAEPFDEIPGAILNETRHFRGEAHHRQGGAATVPFLPVVLISTVVKVIEFFTEPADFIRCMLINGGDLIFVKIEL